MRPAVLLGILLTTAWARPLSSQGSGRYAAILRAEDHRALRAGELALLVRGLSDADTFVLRRALRALGRLERPGQLEHILPLLGHPLAAVRAEAIQAAAQAAQGFRDSTRGRDRSWDALLGALGQRVRDEPEPSVRGALALALGRLPYRARDEIARAQEWLLSLGEGSEGAALTELARGMETLTRLAARWEPPGEAFVLRLRRIAGEERAEPAARRSALGALLSAQAAGQPTLAAALRSGDAMLRRLALTGAARLPAGAEREHLLRAGLADSSGSVRYEALRVAARLEGAAACPSLREAARAAPPHLGLFALDLLGATCAGDSLAAGTLLGALEGAGASWHRAAHALLSLARMGHPRAVQALPAALAAPRWQLRMYAARAAAALRDAGALRRLARDPVANVREAALAALQELSGHADDSLYRAALAASDYQLVLTAAGALAGSPERAAAARAILAGLARISAERRETSRDPRIALLRRLRELGDPGLAPRLLPYLRDFDPAVADSAAALLTAWTGRTYRAAPRRLTPPPISLAELDRLRGARLRFTMESGGGFEVELLVDDAPLSVLRVARLAARGYYDGLTWHRVVPNFVIQGGSPGANEYAGDGPFLRDELGPLSHRRGTLGISTRGRDTGDAQLFVNLIDNPRLDFEYTVWGRVVSGMDVVDGVLEGDAIRRVEIRPR